MKDPVMKKYAKDLIFELMKEWTYGSVPVTGHYRYMVHDVYAILETLRRDRKQFENGKKRTYRGNNGRLYIPDHIGIPAGRVIMIDDDDKYFLDGKYVVCSRNPKIDDGETSFVKTYIDKKYYMARKKFPSAFNNLIIYSVHDFEVFRQGGADFDGDTTLVMMDDFIVDAVAKRKDAPATLDISFKRHEDGSITFYEGCPFTREEKEVISLEDFGLIKGVDYVEQNGFSVEFTEDQYQKHLQRALHDFSKYYMIRTLEENKIGVLTNYATKIQDAIRSMAYMLIENRDYLTNKPLSEEEVNFIKREILKCRHLVRLIRLLQGWEIDRPKHGGVYEEHVDLSFQENPPYYASIRNKKTGELVLDKTGKPIWLTPEWMAARNGVSGIKTDSVLSRIREFVLSEFEEKVVKPFKTMDLSDANNNLIADLALAIQLPTDPFLVEVIKTNVKAVAKFYNQGMAKAIQRHNERLKQFAALPISKQEYEAYKTDSERKMLEEMESIKEEANIRMTTLEKELNVHPAVLGYYAYDITYNDNNKIKRNIQNGSDPCAGMYFPWAGATNQLLSAVALAANKDVSRCTFKTVRPRAIRTSFGNLTFSPAQTAKMIEEAGRVYVWNQLDEFTGNRLLNVYVGKQKVGSIFGNKSFPYSGHDKFVVAVSNVEYGKASVSFNADIIQGIEL